MLFYPNNLCLNDLCHLLANGDFVSKHARLLNVTNEIILFVVLF